MTTNFTLRSQEPTPQQARNARRVALLVLLVTAPSLVVFGLLSYQLAAWQMFSDTVIMFANGVAAFVGLKMIQRGRVVLGVQIIISGIGLGLLALNLLLAGLGILLGVGVGLLITAIASLTLPESKANPIIVTAFGLGLFIVLLDAILPEYRLTVPELNAYVPLVIIVFAIPCIYFIARQFGSYSMRGKLTLTLLVVTILPVILQAVVAGILAESNLTTGAQSTLRAAADQTANRIDRFIRDGLLDIRASARLPEVVDFLSAPPAQRTTAQLAPILNALSSKNLYIRSYAVFDLNGITLFDTAQLNIGTDQLNQPYVREPLQTGQSYFSEVLFDKITDEGLIHFSAPIVRPGSEEIIGIARVAYSIRAVQNLVDESEGLGGNESYGYLFDEHHLQLAGKSDSPSAFKFVLPLSAEMLSTLRTDGRIPDIEAAGLSMNLPELDAGLAQADTQPFFVADAIEANSTNQWVAVRLKDRPTWLMVFSRPQQIFLAPVNDLAHSSLFLVLAISTVTVIAAARISRALAQPIVSLNNAVSKIAQGDLSVQATVETNDEIGALATTFNSMTNQLRTLITSLEEQVRARTAQLRTSAEVGRAATSILDADQLLREAVNLITDRFGFYYAAIFTLDNTGHAAVLREATGDAGHTLMERGHQLAVTNQSMVGAAILTQRARIALDVGQGAVRFANPLLPNTRSEIALPLIANQRVIGALDVQSTQSNAFDEASAEVLQTVADQLAVALINAQTLSRAERQARVLEQLNQLSRDLAQTNSLDSISTAISKNVVQLVDPHQLSLSLVAANPSQVTVYPLYRGGTTILGQGQLVDISQTITGEAFRQGETVYINDLSTLADQHGVAAALYAEGSRSLLAVPLRAASRTLGALNVSHRVSNGFTAEQIAQLEQVAAQVAVALENYNLAEQTRTTLQELDAANRRLIGQAWARYTRASDTLTGEWREGHWIAGAQAQLPPANTHSLAVPIRVRGETIGEFSVQTDDHRIWTEDDVTFAQALIDQVGQVIENARLLEETERFAQREQRIRQITTRIRAASDVQAVLQATTTELAQSLGVSRAIMRLTMGEADTTDGQPRTSPETAAV